MNFTFEKNLLINKDEPILVPYFSKADLENQLKYLGLENVSLLKIESEKGKFDRKVFFLANNEKISITFLPLGDEKILEVPFILEVFGGFAKEVNENHQILLEGIEEDGFSIDELSKIIIRAMFLGGYCFSKKLLLELKNNNIYSMRGKLIDDKTCVFTFISSKVDIISLEMAMERGKCINYARMLGDMPNNYLHVEEFANYLIDMAKDYNLEYEVLGEKELKTLECGGILGVNAGSENEPKLIAIKYNGGQMDSTIALIGKGVMFDSGGYHLKSMDQMNGMKYDMCGAANMAAAFEMAVRKKSEKNIMLVVPLVENVINSNACKMGDVLKTMSGKTVEVYNTDAEGRLILCDAITYAIKNGAKTIIDMATLTGSCHGALGDEISGAFCNDGKFFECFDSIAKNQGEKIWRMPLDNCYSKLLKNSITADLINHVSGACGAASIAACFLQEFVEEKTWLHLDIVGTSVNRGAKKGLSNGATGVMVESIIEFLSQ